MISLHSTDTVGFGTADGSSAVPRGLLRPPVLFCQSLFAGTPCRALSSIAGKAVSVYNGVDGERLPLARRSRR